MNSIYQQTYYWEDGFRFIPQDGRPLKISGKQYFDAVRFLEEKASYIPTKENPAGTDHFEEREFLLGDCLARLNAYSELHEGKNTKIIRVFSQNSYSLERLAEGANLPLPQWT